MGEYEPNDSRDVTLNPSNLPGEPPRTGPREGEAQGKRPEGAHRKEPPLGQHNNAQEETGGDLPDPQRAGRGYDQDEG